MKYIILGIALLFSLSCNSKQEVNTGSDNDSINYLNLVYKTCPNPDILEVEKTENGYIEVEYLCNGQLYEMAISDQSIIYTETKADIQNVPMDKIQRKIEKKYGGWLLDEISEIKTSDTSFLKVELVKDGIEQNLYFTNDGKWFKMKSLAFNDKLLVNKIENNSTYKSFDYSILHPDQIYELPDLLKEVSGIALNSNKVFCIQDEIGAIFEYDLNNEEIKNIHRFTDVGDFEDITFNNKLAYILRSDGSIFQYNFKNSTKPEQVMLSLNSLNVEGLTFFNNHLYVASKDPQVDKSITKRYVYKISNDNFSLPEIFLEIDITEINKFIQDKFPEISSGDLVFNPSAIAVHPTTKEFYIISSSDRILATYSNNALKYAIPLPSDIYFKPEGLAFYQNGDLLISSEGDKKGLIKGSIALIKKR